MKKQKTKIYDCQTLNELTDFVAIRKKIPREFIRIDDELHIYIGSVECTQWRVEKSSRRIHGIAGYCDWYTLHQERRKCGSR